MRPISLIGVVLGAWLVVAGPASAVPAPALTLTPSDRDALARVAIAEAANQGDSGIAAVVQTILNRLLSGAWGSTVGAVVDAPHQFEPVARAGGDWRRLPEPSDAQRARVDTILALIADGRLPDFIGGALYFQNPRVVAARVAAGITPGSRLNFGGRTPSAVIGDHAFYAAPPPVGQRVADASADTLFIGPPAPTTSAGPPAGKTAKDQGEGPSAPPERGIFILPDGRLAEDGARPTADH